MCSIMKGGAARFFVGGRAEKWFISCAVSDTK